MIRALAAGGRDLDVMRIVARAGIDPPAAWDRFDASFQRTRADVVRALKANLPDLKRDELIFRTRAAAHTRPCLSMAKLCTVVLLFQIASSPQYGEAAAGGWSPELGVSGSRTISLI